MALTSTIQTTNGTAARRADPFPVRSQGPVDIATFKPVFNVRKDDEEESSREDRKKAKKEKKKRKGVLSFDVGEEGEDDSRENKGEKKRRKKAANESGRISPIKEPVAATDESQWVEKPEIKPRFVGRKGAADYM